jgi:hypothetical protein
MKRRVLRWIIERVGVDALVAIHTILTYRMRRHRTPPGVVDLETFRARRKEGT